MFSTFQCGISEKKNIHSAVLQYSGQSISISILHILLCAKFYARNSLHFSKWFREIQVIAPILGLIGSMKKKVLRLKHRKKERKGVSHKLTLSSITSS